MNKAQIKAELRRSACEGGIPLLDIRISDGDMVLLYEKFVGDDEWLSALSMDGNRIFFLLVAEAL